MVPAVRCAFAASILLSAPALADDYDEFRVPEHRVSDWSASFSARSNGSTQSSYFERESRSREGSISTRAFWLRDSDPARTAFSVAGFAGAQRSRRTEENDSFFFTYDQATKSTDANENWGLSAEHRWYPGGGAIGYTASAVGQGFYDQSWNHQSTFVAQEFAGTRTVDIAKDRNSQWRYTTQAVGSLGIGAGRVRDATAAYDAQVLEQRLLAAGALARPLSDAARRRVLALLYVRYAHRAVLDRPGRALWREVAAILAEDGAVEGQLEPEAVLRAMEPHLSRAGSLPRDGIPASPVLRQVGWFAGMIVQARHGRTLFRSDRSSYRERTVNDTLQPIIVVATGSRTIFDEDEVGIGPAAEYHRPLGPRWQLDALSQAIFPIKDPAHALRLNSSVSLYWLAADRWLVDVRVGHRRDFRYGGIFAGSAEFSLWQASYQASVRYYLEDHLELMLSAGEQQASDDRYFDTLYSRDGSVTLSLTYRLLGRIEAPSLMEPLRVGAL